MIDVKAPYRQSALSHREAIKADELAMAERPFQTKITLRADAKDLSKVVKKALGVNAPKPLTSVIDGQVTIHWVGPDTLLIFAEDGAEADLLSKLEKAMSGVLGQVVPVSNYYTTIELSGAKAREALQKLSTLDLHPTAFKKAAVANTVLGHSNVTLACREDAPDAFDVTIRISHADYLWCLLANAGYEFGLPAQTPMAGETLRQ